MVAHQEVEFQIEGKSDFQVWDFVIQLSVQQNIKDMWLAGWGDLDENDVPWGPGVAINPDHQRLITNK